MSDRNWEAELAKIDQQLASVSDEQLLATRAPPAAPGKGAAPPARAFPAAKAAAAPSVAAPGTVTRPWVSWAKVLVAIAAAAGLMFWPWPGQCGVLLLGFTAATGGVAFLGLWSAIGTWRHRLGVAHVASLLVVVWGLVLGAREVLPRTGYAVPTPDRAASWRCPAATVAPSAAVPSKFP
jgi:hypothetical protein